jgi:gliding motility-associated-like protein
VSLPATVSIIVNPVPVAPTANGTIICSGGTATLTATAPGGTYDWYSAATGGTLLGSGATFTTPSLTATTTYYVQSTSNGCTGPRTAVTVTVSPSFSVTTTADDSICAGTSTTLGVISPVGTYTYTWNAPGNPAFSTNASPSVTPASTTTYTVTVADANGCSGSDVVTITVGTPLTLNAAGLPASCFGSCDGSAGVMVAGSFPPYTYSWTNGSTTQLITGLCAGTDSVIVTDLIGCSSGDSVMIQEPTQLTLTTSSVNATCNQADGSASVIASGGVSPYTYQWLPGNFSGATANNITPGSYTITVSDSHNCQSSASVTVNNTPGVVAMVSGFTNATCNGLCDGTASVTATGGSTPYVYSWSNGQTSANTVALCAGTYTCIVSDATGCTSTVTVTITQPSAVFVEPFPPGPTICIGQSATLSASAIGGSPGYTFTWDNQTYTGNPYIVSPTTPGIHTYTVIASDANGCTSPNTQTVQVTVRPALNVVASNDENICQGTSALLSAVGSGGDLSYTYTWTPGGTASTTSNFSVSPSVTTTYTITLTDNCTSTPATDVVTITVKPLPVVNFAPSTTSGCAPLCVNFMDQSIGNVTGWNWTIDGITYNTQNPTHCFTSAGSYSVTLSDTAGGCESSLTIPDMITVSSMPEPEFTYDPQPASINYPEIHFTDQSTYVSSWSWNFGDSLNVSENTSNASSPDHTYSDVGQYCVKLIVYNTPACVDSVTHCLIIEPDYTLYIPNAFTPNGSGLNDEFYVKGENIQLFDMQIYDRWGTLLFHTSDIKEHWNGSYKNGTEVAPVGVYVYVINIKDKVGEKHQYIGHVTIVK